MRQGPYLQLAGTAKRSEGKAKKENADEDRETNEPVSSISAPGADSGVKPANGEHGKCGADDFMEELFKDAPKTAEPARFDGLRDASSGNNRRHESSLAQNGKRRWCRSARPEVQVSGL